MTTIEHVRDILKTGFPDAAVYVKNPLGDGAHFYAVVVSESFTGKGILARHREVLSLMKEALETDVHALSFKAYTPGEWEEKPELHTKYMS